MQFAGQQEELDNKILAWIEYLKREISFHTTPVACTWSNSSAAILLAPYAFSRIVPPSSFHSRGCDGNPVLHVITPVFGAQFRR
jgi:hypothetical protein